MKQEIVICTQDVVFGRMLELEFSFHGCSAQTVGSVPVGTVADVVLLDLDSAAAPPPDSYRRMIGFTRGRALSEDRTRRQCAMILHRPFEVRLLLREVLGEDEEGQAPDSLPLPSFSSTGGKLLLGGRELSLSPTEERILRYLLAHRGEAVSRSTLSELIGASSANKTDVYICYLRREIAKITPVNLIVTVRGKGYMVE
ncbi:MAG: winged-helix domain-containing protein [Ruminococcaceae bacterium]|nr:winged-helix domain-containing protein [Oscillospiraceae bacterium]